MRIGSYRLAVVLGIIGMAFGIVMGIRQDFTLAPAHAHLNLLGWVGLFLAGLYYQAVPGAAASKLAYAHAFTAMAGAILLPDRNRGDHFGRQRLLAPYDHWFLAGLDGDAAVCGRRLQVWNAAIHSRQGVT